MMRALQFAAVGALTVSAGRQGVVRTALVAPRFGNFSLGNSHGSSFPNPMNFAN
jgi:hypothetical protein